MKSILLSVTILLTLLLGTEAGFRLYYHVPLFRGVHPPVYHFDPYTGFTLDPGQDFLNFHSNGVAHLRTDRYGFVGSGHDVSSDRKKILILGDSFMEAQQVHTRYNAGVILEGLFRKSGIPADVYNTGVSGWNPEQYYQRFNHLPKGLRPDAVILSLFTGNDLDTNGDKENQNIPTARLVSQKLTWVNLPLRRLSRKTPRRVDPLILTKFFKKRISFLKQMIHEHNARNRSIGKNHPVSSLARKSVKSDVTWWGPLKHLMKIYRIDNGIDTSLQQSQEILRAILRDINEDCLRRKIPFLVVLIPEQRELYTDIWNLGLEVLGAKPGDYDRHRARAWLMDFFQESDIDVLDLYPFFEKRRDIYLPNDGHFTPAGHRVTAEKIFDRLQDHF